LSSCAQGSRFCGIQPGQSNYTSQAHQFDNACYNAGVGSHACDFVAYLLEPDLALSWLSNGSTSTPAYGAGGAQPLFDRQAFASQCDACNISSGFVAWTGYQPPEGSFTGQPAETAYVNLLHSGNSSIDVDNQIVEGGYIGMNLFMNALRAVGPDLTRARLKAVLDSTTDHNGLSRPLVFRPGNHLANAAAMGWRLNYANGQFTGFSPVTKFQTDPWLGQDLNAPTK
jgi:hypothetical protein